MKVRDGDQIFAVLLGWLEFHRSYNYITYTYYINQLDTKNVVQVMYYMTYVAVFLICL